MRKKIKDHRAECGVEQIYVELYDEKWDFVDEKDLNKKFIFGKMHCQKCGETYLRQIPLTDFSKDKDVEE